MIQLPPQALIHVLHEPVSFRNGIDGTAAIARLIIGKDPMCGAFFVFRSKGGECLRILFYDSSGFWLATKRLSKGKFRNWPKGDGVETSSNLLARELQILLWGGDPASACFPDLWRKVS